MITKPCPKCGKRCPQWPNCTYTQPVPESVKLRKAGQRGMFDEEPT